MAAKPLPSQDVLRQLLRYDAETGNLFWLPRDDSWFAATTRSASGTANIWNAKHAHSRALTFVSEDGYARGKILRAMVAAHRVIFKMAYNCEPVNIDHINRDRLDNRLANLREANLWQNSANSVRSYVNTSGFRGVYKPKGASSWLAAIRDPHTKRKVHIGSFKTALDAALAYDAMAKRTYGAFAVTNFAALEAKP